MRVYEIPSWAIILSLQPRERWTPFRTALLIFRINLLRRLQ